MPMSNGDSPMKTRPFPWKCGDCRERALNRLLELFFAYPNVRDHLAASAALEGQTATHWSGAPSRADRVFCTFSPSENQPQRIRKNSPATTAATSASQIRNPTKPRTLE